MFAQFEEASPTMFKHETVQLPFRNAIKHKPSIVFNDTVPLGSRFKKNNDDVCANFKHISDSDQNNDACNYEKDALFNNLYGVYNCISKYIADNRVFLLEMLKITALLVIIIFQFLIYKSGANYINNRQFARQSQNNPQSAPDLALNF